MAKQKTFSVTMEYLREIVARHMFHDSPAAALRELIQNAHDACMIHAAITGTDQYSVHIILDPDEKTITIQDNGIGMSFNDIEEYLTTIGKGKKGASINEKWGSHVRNERRLENVIGEFGFGFIAAFIIADKIELWTKSATEGSRPIHCVFSTEAVEYQAEEATEHVDQGTKLVLHLNERTYQRGFRPTDNPLEGNILAYDTVEAIVKKYCILLEFPIFVTIKGERPDAPSNVMALPWESKQNIRESLQRFYKTRGGLECIGQIAHVINLSFSRRRGDPVSLEGVLFFENSPSYIKDEGNVEIFVKRMWVCEHQQSLVPDWASFLSGIIVTPDLRPMPGRDSLDSMHATFDRVKNFLHQTISDAFLEIAQTNPKSFNEMLQHHGPRFRWGLVKEKDRAEEEKRKDMPEAELFRFVRFVQYSRKYLNGAMCNLNEYLEVAPQEPLKFERGKKVIHIVPRPIPYDRQFEFRRLLTSRNVNVIIPNDDSELALLSAIDGLYSDVLVRSIESDLLRTYAGLLEGEERARWLPFLKYFQRLSKDHHMAGADIGDAEPSYMPALILNIPEAGETHMDVDSVGDDEKQREEGEQGKKFSAGLPPEYAHLYQQTLIINARNDTMKQLLEYYEHSKLEEIDEVIAICLHECYHIALQAALDFMHGEVMKHHLDVSSLVLKDYLTAQKERLRAEEDVKKAQEDLARSQDELKTVRAKVTDGFEVPEVPEERMGVVVFCDLIGSTASLVAMDFDQRGMVLQEFVDLARNEVQKQNGFFVSFTGDGMIALFGVENKIAGDRSDAGSWNKACEEARLFSNAMEAAMVEFNARPEIKKVVDRNPALIKDLKLRTAVSAGPILFGRFGSRGNAVGLPVIEAARLCSEEQAFITADTSILFTDEFQVRSDQRNLEQVTYEFRPKGYNNNLVPIYRKRR